MNRARNLISALGALCTANANFLPRNSHFERRQSEEDNREAIARSEKCFTTRQCDSGPYSTSVIHQVCVSAKSLFQARPCRLVAFASGAATQLSKFMGVALSGKQNRSRDAYPGNTSPHAGRKAPRRALPTSWSPAFSFLACELRPSWLCRPLVLLQRHAPRRLRLRSSHHHHA